VIAGTLLMPLARRNGSQLIPVDSEHSAVFQALRCGKLDEVRRIILTASGGPFRTWPAERIEHATIDEALAHPTWAMGPKITIDSATMMNKALEIIEARHLFELSADQIEVLIHPESIVHSMVEFRDGSTIAQLGAADMRTPIQYAMTYPDRSPGVSEELDWSRIGGLHFESPDFDRFPALRLGFQCARIGGTSGAVLNAANEAAVEKFRQGGMPFGEITRILQHVFGHHDPINEPTLEQLMRADAWARDEVFACC
jgi:1-deoxy-D-xylulose-5-phosphate reductoisomerase